MTTEFIVRIVCDNAAHVESFEDSIAENLGQVVDAVYNGNRVGYLYDYNGNRVGEYFLKINENNT
jgi:hypothetical protein